MAAGLSSSPAPLRGADGPDAVVTLVAPGANVFADREVEIRLRVTAVRPLAGRLSARFAAGRATVAAKDADVTAGPILRSLSVSAHFGPVAWVYGGNGGPTERFAVEPARPTGAR